MITIHKYQLPCGGMQTIQMPAGSRVLCVQVQHGQPCLWAQVDTDEPVERRRFYVVGTGHAMPSRLGEYVGTFQLEGGALVFHVFEG